MTSPLSDFPVLPDTAINACGWLAAFEWHAAASPDNIAVSCGDHTQTYSELLNASYRVTNHLHAHGIGQGDLVGMGMDRCVELPATLLGVIRSGAAYVPLDPAYPAERIARMISSAKLEWVLATDETERFFLDSKVLRISEAIDETEPSTTPGKWIYAIFTSGSTGEPKAALVRHAGFSNLLNWYVSECALGTSDRTLVISSPSFDLTQKNFFAPLASGGRLVLDESPTYDISRILTIIRNEGITLINCTPSAFYPLVDAAADDGYHALSSLRFAVLGGEPISIPRLRDWLESRSCHAEVMNSYGPTECADICTFHRLHRENLDDYPFVPLGQEIPNMRVTIRDEDLRELANGMIGELCIEGAGVGDGYLHDPDRTASRFVDGMYRTGDMAKRLDDGILEFRGRADHQVKVNGHRIELGEIEIALNTHDEVREAIVIAADGRMVAHVRGTANAEKLHAHLAARLPAYMIPSEFRFLEYFPLTPNGKVDRLALAASTAPQSISTTYDDSLESKIMKLWSGVIGRRVNDASANFFDLGGNSIQLAVAHVKLVKMTGRDFPITELFARPNVRALARFLSPEVEAGKVSNIQDRARLAKAGYSSFRRPTPR